MMKLFWGPGSRPLALNIALLALLAGCSRAPDPTAAPEPPTPSATALEDGWYAVRLNDRELDGLSVFFDGASTVRIPGCGGFVGEVHAQGGRWWVSEGTVQTCDPKTEATKVELHRLLMSRPWISREGEALRVDGGAAGSAEFRKFHVPLPE